MEKYTDDDLNVIIQDWSDSDPDQAVAINLSREVLRLRAAARRAVRALLAGQPGPIVDDVVTYNLDGMTCGSALIELRDALGVR